MPFFVSRVLIGACNVMVCARSTSLQARQNVHNQGASGIFLYPTSFADRGVLVLAGKYAPFKVRQLRHPF